MTSPSRASEAAAPAQGTVCTFYSYKGGVGRTFALANVAVLLATWGYRVLCIDWDLEAPGLHVFFEPLLAPDTLGDGVVELVERSRAEPDVDWTSAVAPVPVPSAAGRLDLMPAGRFDDSYVDRLQQLDWAELYEEDALGASLERARAQWVQTYDAVLIDSRTGITDVGGICTVQLPDIVVFSFTPNQQSIDGVLDVLQRAEERRGELPFERPRLRALPLVTRFEASVTQAAEWTKRIEKTLEPVLAAWSHRNVGAGELLTHTRIPYVPHWSFGEGLPVIDEGTADPLSIGYAFETVAALVALGLEGTERLVANRQSYVDQARRRGEEGARGAGAFPLDAVVLWDRKDKHVPDLVQRLRGRGLRIWIADEPGSPWPRLTDAVEHTRSLIVAVGDGAPAAVEREYAQLASGATAHLVIPVLLTRDPEAIPASLRTFQWIVAGADEELQQAVQHIERLLLEQRHTVLAETQGLRHADTLAAKAAVAGASADAGDLDEARRVYEQLVEDWTVAAGREDPRTLQAIEDFATTLARLGDPATARPLFERLVADRRRLLGPGHADTLATTMLLAEALAAESDAEAAIATYRDLATLIEGLYGEEDSRARAARAAAADLEQRRPPRPVTFDQHAFVNRHAELELFAHARRPGSPIRLLLIEDRGGTGKTMLLRRFRYACEWEDHPRTPVGDVDLNEMTTLIDLVRRLHSSLRRSGADFPTFERYDTARLLGDLSAIDTRDVRSASTGPGVIIESGSVNVSGRLPPEAEEVLIERAVAGFLDDLLALAEKGRVVLLLDAYEGAPAAARDWIERELLLRGVTGPEPGVLTVLAGRDLHALRALEDTRTEAVSRISGLSTFRDDDLKALLEFMDVQADSVDVEYLAHRLEQGWSLERALAVINLWRGETADPA
jgi:MinD-like ATPase involved in chromosome partitioning or flagellar assembly